MKVQRYSLDDIFEKRLLMLISFYIFSHESSYPEYNSSGQKLEKLKAEYQVILERLDEEERARRYIQILISGHFVVQLIMALL